MHEQVFSVGWLGQPAISIGSRLGKKTLVLIVCSVQKEFVWVCKVVHIGGSSKEKVPNVKSFKNEFLHPYYSPDKTKHYSENHLKKILSDHGVTAIFVLALCMKNFPRYGVKGM